MTSSKKFTFDFLK